MAKLSKLLLKALFYASANAQDEPTFQVTSCNVDVSMRPGENKEVNNYSTEIIGKRQDSGVSLDFQL